MNPWLVVDDHPAIGFAVKSVLASVGNNPILTATDGTTALAKIKGKAPELVILDIMLNKMDGLQILQHIRQIDSTIKVVVYTGLPTEIYAERALRAGACGFFSKDHDISQLVPLCQLVLQGFSCFPQAVIAPLTQQPVKNGNDKNSLALLSDREITVLRYLADGMSNKDIADRLILSNKTISTYKRRLMEKLKVNNQDELSTFIDNESKMVSDE
jgi:two-component system response regulator FimZ (fimbrial Z protein)/two-component system response regulator EvgA